MNTKPRARRSRRMAMCLVLVVALVGCSDPRGRLIVKPLNFGGSGHTISAEIYVENTGTVTRFRWSLLSLRMPDGTSAAPGHLVTNTPDAMFVFLPVVTSTYWTVPQPLKGKYVLTYRAVVLATFVA